MKLTHEQAGYREDGAPSRQCQKCSMYRLKNMTDTCTLVQDIIWHGTCRYFEAKK